MIRINLLKPLQAQPAPMIAEPAVRKQGLIFALAALVLVGGGVVIFLQYPTLVSGLFSKSQPIVAAPEPSAETGAQGSGAAETGHPAAEPAPQPKQVTAQAVEEIVREIQDEQGRGAPPAYADLVPSEKIEFQYFACTRILKDIKAITPPEVGFADFIFTPPGDFYVRGLAYDQQHYEKFKAGLAGLAGAEIRPGRSAPVGSKSAATEFSFYGTVKYPLGEMQVPPDRVVSKAKLDQEMQQLKTVATALGIHFQDPRLLSTRQSGNVRKMVFQASADCNFQQMQDFLSQLYESKSNLGFVKFALHARGDEQVMASLDILAYVN